MVGFVVKKHPAITLVIPIIVLLVLTGLGVYGTLAGAQNMVDSNKEIARSIAFDTSTSFTLTVQKVRKPLGHIVVVCYLT